LILFVHGWGYDASFWDPLRARLADIPSSALDLGYFGAPNMTIPTDVRFLVGHSLGYLWLARQEKLRHLPLLGINAFPRFLEARDYKPAVAPRLVERMRRHLEMDPSGVLSEFWQRAGAPGPNRAPKPEALTSGLDDLAIWDERENLAARGNPTYLIAGEVDAIVPPAMTNMAFKDFGIDWLPGGHALPWTHPADVETLIGFFV